MFFFLPYLCAKSEEELSQQWGRDIVFEYSNYLEMTEKTTKNKKNLKKKKIHSV